MPQTPSSPRLRLIAGGLATRWRVGTVAVGLAALEAPIPPLDAVVIEDDTYLVLGAAPIIREPTQGLEEIQHELSAFEPPPPGSVLVRRGRPLELLAIVHELEHTPSWRPEWIESALQGVLQQAARHRLGTLAMPLLGTVHGRMAEREVLQMLVNTLRQQPRHYPHELWLAVPRERLSAIRCLLDELTTTTNSHLR